MKILSCIDCKFSEKKYLYEALSINIDRKNIISVVGGGGKTSFIYNLAHEIQSLGKKVLITTTTNMFIPDKYFVCSNDFHEINNMLSNNGIAVLGRQISDKKFTSMDTDIYDNLVDIYDFLLIESDGARRLPLKAPGKHEPVIFHKTNLIVGVAGIDSIGQQIKDICHRKEIVCDVLDTDESHVITEGDVAMLLSSDKGQRKYVDSFKGRTDYIAVINKCDNEELVKKAEIISEFLGEKNINSIITSFK